jgi:uncharacterized protein YkwD
MPDAPRPSVPRGLLIARVATVTAGALGAVTAIALGLTLAVSGASGAGAEPTTAPPTATPLPLDGVTLASLLGLPAGVAIAPELDVVAFAEFVEAASQPAPTPTVALPAPPPPAPANRPAAPLVPTPTPEPPPPPAPSSGLDTSPMDGYAQDLFNRTNARRVANGLPPLRVNGYLIGIARIRSRDMADHNYFAHTSPVTGDTAFSLMDTYGIPYGWAGENLAKNNYSNAETVAVADEALWNSAPHRENILNPNFTDMGIALVIDATGMKYFTIIFSGP